MAKRKSAARRRPNVLRSLRRRLKEAEDTLDAIRQGHVDAVVVQAPDGEQIYTLRTADQPYRIMVEQMHEGALTLSAAGIVLYCNTRFADLLGRPSTEVTGLPLATFIASDDHPKLDALLGAAAFRDECQLLVSEVTRIPVQLSATALTIDDVRTVAVVVSDLTQERTEKALRESNRLKDEFLATLSHELRTPLNVVLGWTRMLLSGQVTPETRQHALELVEKNARAQAQIVSDLVEMSRITTGKMRLDVEAVPMAPAVEAALDNVRLSAEAKGLTLETVWHAVDAVALADATRLQQILWNLLSNAVKFTPAGGRIQVSVARADDGVRIEVTDSGIGIDPKFVPHVFDRFRQAESGTTRGFGGLGLGLAIVHDLVRLHSGQVEARSTGIGHGSTFAFTLPPAGAVPERAAPARRAPVRRGSLSGRSVLLIEDHEDSRELTTRILENAGATVEACASAAEAFAALQRRRPAVIVADIGIPDEDGLSLMRRVRAHSAQSIRSVPAIALTAYTSSAERQRALDAGYLRHVEKPVDPDLLIEILTQLVHDGE